MDFLASLQRHPHVFNLLASLATSVQAAERTAASSFNAGNRLMFCGNGGSAADAQHLATELVGGLVRDRLYEIL